MGLKYRGVVLAIFPAICWLGGSAQAENVRTTKTEIEWALAVRTQMARWGLPESSNSADYSSGRPASFLGTWLHRDNRGNAEKLVFEAEAGDVVLASLSDGPYPFSDRRVVFDARGAMIRIVEGVGQEGLMRCTLKSAEALLCSRVIRRQSKEIAIVVEYHAEESGAPSWIERHR